jgi:hypothetical protein
VYTTNMYVNESFVVLMWIVCIMLALFLALSIAVLVMVIRFITELRRIAAKAETIVDSAEAVGEFFRHATGPVAVGQFIANIANAVLKRKQPKKRGGYDE